ncbi:MAG: hypothetical protein V4579_01230 [Pseudomonadota bacterium]
MDLNELLFQQQRAIKHAATNGQPTQGSRFDLVNYYGRRIRNLRDSLGAAELPAWLTATKTAL